MIFRWISNNSAGSGKDRWAKGNEQLFIYVRQRQLPTHEPSKKEMKMTVA